MENNKRPYYSAIGSICFLPGNAAVPRFVKKTHHVDNQRLGNAMRVYRQTLEEAIGHLENEVTHWHQTLSVLSRIVARQAQISHVLSSVPVDSLDVVTNEDYKTQHYNDYFGIREAADMDVLEFAAVDARVTYDVLLELMETGLDEFELANFLRSVVVRWAFIEDALLEKSAGKGSQGIDEEDYLEPVAGDERGLDDPVLISFHRWRIAHHAFALDAIYANFFLACASQELVTNRVTEATTAIRKAGTTLRAATVCMLLASKMPRAIYNDHVRPSMGLGFSGSDNLWWNQLIQTIQTVIEQAKTLNSPALNQALLDFHEKYLQDIELHTWIASKLVGSRPSLTLEEINSYGDKTQRNERFATADLRSLHYIRQYEFGFLHYYPILHRLFTAQN